MQVKTFALHNTTRRALAQPLEARKPRGKSHPIALLGVNDRASQNGAIPQ
jgi:hypothetical protein